MYFGMLISLWTSLFLDQSRKKQKLDLSEASLLWDKPGSTRSIVHCAPYQTPTMENKWPHKSAMKWSVWCLQVTCLKLVQLPPRVTITGQAMQSQPCSSHSSLTPQGWGWGWHEWSPGHLNWAEPGTPCGKTKERKVVMDCNKLVGSETSPLTFITCTGYVQIKSETLRVRQNSYRGSLDQIKVLEKRKPSCRVWYSRCRWGDASLPAGTAGIHPSSLPPSCQGLSQSLQTSLLSLGGLEGGLGSAGSPTAKNNQPLPICDRNRRKHIVKFREGLMAISPNPFVFWH